MIDYAFIFTTGGVVLWCKAFCDTSFKLDIANMFIKTVLLDDKSIHKNTYNHQDNILRWKMQEDLNVVFAIVYKEILQLTMIDDLLEMIKFDFTQNIWPQLDIKGDIIHTLPPNYDQRFNQILIQWEEMKSKPTIEKSG